MSSTAAVYRRFCISQYIRYLSDRFTTHRGRHIWAHFIVGTNMRYCSPLLNFFASSALCRRSWFFWRVLYHPTVQYGIFVCCSRMLPSSLWSVRHDLSSDIVVLGEMKVWLSHRPLLENLVGLLGQWPHTVDRPLSPCHNATSLLLRYFLRRTFAVSTSVSCQRPPGLIRD